MSGETILVIDDSREIVKHLTEHMLPAFGYITLHAYDGQAGLQLIRDGRPDLVMLDFHLPEMTGIDVLQRMAQESLSTPVVLMTGFGSEQSAIDAFRLGVKDYIIKPFTVDEIIETIDRALVHTRLLHDNELLAEQLRRTKVELSRQAYEMETLSNIGKAVTSLLRVDKVLARVLEAARQLTDAETSAIWRPDKTGEYLVPYDEKGLAGDESQKLLMADSLVGEVMESGRPLRQALSSGESIRIAEGTHARAILFVPLKLRGLTMGVLGTSNSTLFHTFSKQDEFLLATLADYAAVSLENAQVLQAADQALAARLDELNILGEVAQAITSSLDLDEVVRMTIKQVHDSWDIEASSLWLLDETEQNLRVLANVGTPDDVLSQMVLSVDQGIVGAVTRTGKWIYSNDVSTHPFHYQKADTLTGFETRSILCVPLIFRDQVVGAMELLNKSNGGFDDQDVERALSIASAVAIAVSNALLFKEAKVRKQHLEATLEQYESPILLTDTADHIYLLNQVKEMTAALHESDPLNENQTQIIDQIVTATGQMLALVNGLLELAKIDTALQQESQVCNLLEIVTEVMHDYQEQALSRQVSLVFTAEPGIKPIQGHPHQLRRAIGNLVDNAIKFSPAERVVEIIVAKGVESVVIQVWDNGEGIAETDLPYIFDKFYRGQGEEDQVGSGLGLTLAHSIAVAHGGKIWLESRNGDGATFFLEIPIEE
ncbi:MAG: GAF domain-containing protein [Chloroflexi bacterium]|nr:GAF domain-containing protein [Chloroflexota bacterium]